MIAISQLRAFAAVVEVGTVTGAASAISRTQPQVSRLVTELEAEIGFNLFSREGRKLILTKRGARLYDEIKHALDSFDSIKHAAERIRSDAESELRILAPTYVAHTILPRALETFRERFPTRAFSVEIVVRNAMGAWFPYRPFDIGVAALPFELPTVKIRRFAAADSVVILPQGHPLTKKNTIALVDLAPYDFIALGRNAGFRKRLDAVCEREGVTLKIAGDTTNSISACEMVAQGMGVTILNVLVPQFKKSLPIEIRPWKPGLVTELGLVYPVANPQSPVVDEFSTIVREVVRASGVKMLGQ